MSYQALYRKWRPGTFEDVQGQDHIVRTLKNQLRSGRVGHAYLFCGSRGTGKTSVAKIFARAVNCENPADGEPCNECAMCRAAIGQRSMNVIEIDAASNNGVDNIRQIREEVAFSPAEGRYKVYIIDEVHMLSTGAFNALLKTLEEPPSYVIFILATTEAHRIPATILSRCQRYDFHRIPSHVIAGRLSQLCQAEGIDADQNALSYIARKAEGSMRDALSIMDQCVSLYMGEKLSYEKLLDILGIVDMSVFSRLFRSVTEADAKEALAVIDEALKRGRDLSQFTEDFTMYLRNLMMIRSDSEELAGAYVSPEQMATLREDTEYADMDTIMRFIRIFSELSGSMRYSSQKRIILEMAVVKLCRPAMERDLSSLIQRIDILEKRLEEFQAVPQTADMAAKRRKEAEQAQRRREDLIKQAEERKKAAPELIRKLIDEWAAVTAQAKAPMQIMLKKTSAEPGEGDQLIVICRDEIGYNYLSADEHLKELKSFIAQKAGGQIDIMLRNAARHDSDHSEDFDPLSFMDTEGIEVELL